MARAYSARQSSRSKDTELRAHGGRFTWMIIAFIFGYLTAEIYPLENFIQFISHAFKSSGLQSDAETAHNHAATATPAALPRPKPKFEFYTLLTKDNNPPIVPVATNTVAADPIPATPAITPITTQTPHTTAPVAQKIQSNSIIYAVQVAAFNRKNDAEKLKAALLLKGYAASISILANAQTTWYRVVIGPFKTHLDAEKAQIVVAQHEHLQGMIRKV